MLNPTSPCFHYGYQHYNDCLPWQWKRWNTDIADSNIPSLYTVLFSIGSRLSDWDDTVVKRVLQSVYRTYCFRINSESWNSRLPNPSKPMTKKGTGYEQLTTGSNILVLLNSLSSVLRKCVKLEEWRNLEGSNVINTVFTSKSDIKAQRSVSGP